MTRIQLQLAAICLVVGVGWSATLNPFQGLNDKRMRLLRDYGYLSNRTGGGSSSGSVTVEELVKAIRNIQKFAGLPVSGVLDNRTVELLESERCGVKDFNTDSGASDSGAALIGSFTLQGTFWKKTDLTYKVISYTADLPRDQQRRIFKDAFDMWQAATNLKLIDVTDYIPPIPNDSVEILISFVTRDHGDGYGFDGRGGTLAHAFYPGNNRGRSGDAHFDDDEPFSTGTSSGINLDWVALHEFGHSLGLAHSNVRNSVMYPWYSGYKENIALTEDDIGGIQDLYGKPPTVKPTTEKPTTEKPTTEKPTTEEPTTEEPTTEEPTTEEPTTEEPTTEEPTTEEPTTEEPTTEDPTTEEPTTEEPTTEDPTTEEPTTEEPTTEEPTTEEPTTEDPTTEEPTTEEPTTEDPTTEEPTTEEPTTEDPTTEKPTTEEPTTKEPTTEEPTTEEPTTEEPTTEEPTTKEPTTEEPTTEEPTTKEPTTEEPTTEEPTTEEPTTKEPTTEEPTTEESTTKEPTTEEPTTEEPTTKEPTTEEPTTKEPTTEEPTTEEPTTKEPTTEEPTTEEPTTKEPTTEEPTTEEPGTPPDECNLFSYDAFFNGADGKTYAVSGDYYWIIAQRRAGKERGPHKLKERFPRLQTPVDAVFTKHGKTMFFRGSRYWQYRYDASTKTFIIDLTARPVREYGLPSSLNDMDAAFVYRNTRIYFFKGDLYWRYNERLRRIDIGYPKNVTLGWAGLRGPFDAVMTWGSDRNSYFFKGENYFRIHKEKHQVDSGYPQNTAMKWMKCYRIPN